MEKQFREQRRQDPYRSDAKYEGNPQCSSCHAIFVRAKWFPEKRALARLGLRRTGELEKTVCPACRQLRDHYAMGVVEMHGERWRSKPEDVFGTVEKTESIARLRNDQQRILWSSSHDGVTRVYVTLPELARHIGRTLAKSFKGRTEVHRSTEEPFIRVIWNSDFEPYRKQAKPRSNKSRQLRGRGRR